MRTILRTWTPRAVLAAVAAVLVLVLVGHVRSDRASAQPRGEVLPWTGAWCGMTQDGGRILFSVTDEASLVRELRIFTRKGDLAAAEDEPRPSARIEDDSFIYRRDREEQRCRTVGSGPGPIRGPICRQAPCDPPRRPPEPCRSAPCARPTPEPPPRQICDTVVLNEILIRGSVTAADSVVGNYSFLAGRAPGRKVVGSYVAWPVALAPCPAPR